MNQYQNPYNAEKIKASHKLLKEFKYDLKSIDKGYANRTLYVNVGKNTIKSKPVIPGDERYFHWWKRI